MLKFESECVAHAAQRFHKALEPIFRVYDPINLLPGLDRNHVFDFRNGLRLIVSRDVVNEGDEPHIHVSASVNPGTELYQAMERGISVDAFIRIAMIYLEDISGKRVIVEEQTFSPEKKVPHFMVRLEDHPPLFSPSPRGGGS